MEGKSAEGNWETGKPSESFERVSVTFANGKHSVSRLTEFLGDLAWLEDPISISRSSVLGSRGFLSPLRNFSSAIVRFPETNARGSTSIRVYSRLCAPRRWLKVAPGWSALVRDREEDTRKSSNGDESEWIFLREGNNLREVYGSRYRSR